MAAKAKASSDDDPTRKRLAGDDEDCDDEDEVEDDDDDDDADDDADGGEGDDDGEDEYEEEYEDDEPVAAASSEFLYLKGFDLARNELSEHFPPVVFQMQALSWLRLRHNNLSSLPDQLWGLTNLDRLDMGSNALSQLPESVTRLEKLQTLSLRHNNFGSDPAVANDGLVPGVFLLKDLRRVNLAYNALRTVPQSLFAAAKPSIIVLSLAHNCITELPAEFSAAFPNLQILDLRHNLLTQGPRDLHLCKALDSLLLGGNKLPFVDFMVCEATQLRSLDISANGFALDDIPSALTKLTGLTSLDLSCNRLASIPEPLFALASLQHLNLSGNTIEYFAAEVRGLTALLSLNLSRNSLHKLPPMLCRITSLVRLDLNANSLTAKGLSLSMRYLERLQVLSLAQNQLEAIPRGLFICASLTKLDVSFNLLTTLPEAVYRLTALRDLNVTGNAGFVMPRRRDVPAGHYTIDEEHVRHLITTQRDRLAAKGLRLRAQRMAADKAAADAAAEAAGKVRNGRTMAAVRSNADLFVEAMAHSVGARADGDLLAQIKLAGGGGDGGDGGDGSDGTDDGRAVADVCSVASDGNEVSDSESNAPDGESAEARRARRARRSFRASMSATIAASITGDAPPADARSRWRLSRAKALLQSDDDSGDGDETGSVRSCLTSAESAANSSGWARARSLHGRVSKPRIDYSDVFGPIDPVEGLTLWRMNKFKPVLVDEADYSTFYSGESYLVLSGEWDDETENLFFRVFFWIGSTTPLDKKCCVAMHAVQLCDYVGARESSHREEEGDESPLFRAAIAELDVQIEPGGFESMLDRVETVSFQPKLYRIDPGTHAPALIDIAIRHLTADDVLVLDVGRVIYTVCGRSASLVHRAVARLYADDLAKERKQGGVVIHDVEALRREGKAAYAQFLAYFADDDDDDESDSEGEGGAAGEGGVRAALEADAAIAAVAGPARVVMPEPRSAVEGMREEAAAVKAEAEAAAAAAASGEVIVAVPEVAVRSDDAPAASSEIVVPVPKAKPPPAPASAPVPTAAAAPEPTTAVATRAAAAAAAPRINVYEVDVGSCLELPQVERTLSRSMLRSDSAYIVDCRTEIYVWLGKRTRRIQKRAALAFVPKFLVIFERPEWTTMTRVLESAEPMVFRAKFPDWNQQPGLRVDYGRHLGHSPDGVALASIGGPTVAAELPARVALKFDVSDLFVPPVELAAPAAAGAPATAPAVAKPAAVETLPTSPALPVRPPSAMRVVQKFVWANGDFSRALHEHAGELHAGSAVVLILASADGAEAAVYYWEGVRAPRQAWLAYQFGFGQRIERLVDLAYRRQRKVVRVTQQQEPAELLAALDPTALVVYSGTRAAFDDEGRDGVRADGRLEAMDEYYSDDEDDGDDDGDRKAAAKSDKARRAEAIAAAAAALKDDDAPAVRPSILDESDDDAEPDAGDEGGDVFAAIAKRKAEAEQAKAAAAAAAASAAIAVAPKPTAAPQQPKPAAAAAADESDDEDADDEDGDEDDGDGDEDDDGDGDEDEDDDDDADEEDDDDDDDDDGSGSTEIDADEGGHRHTMVDDRVVAAKSTANLLPPRRRRRHRELTGAVTLSPHFAIDAARLTRERGTGTVPTLFHIQPVPLSAAAFTSVAARVLQVPANRDALCAVASCALRIMSPPQLFIRRGREALPPLALNAAVAALSLGVCAVTVFDADAPEPAEFARALGPAPAAAASAAAASAGSAVAAAAAAASSSGSDGALRPRLFLCELSASVFSITEVADVSQGPLEPLAVVLVDDSRANLFVWRGVDAAEQKYRLALAAAEAYAEGLEGQGRAVVPVRQGDETLALTSLFIGWDNGRNEATFVDPYAVRWAAVVESWRQAALDDAKRRAAERKVAREAAAKQAAAAEVERRRAAAERAALTASQSQSRAAALAAEEVETQRRLSVASIAKAEAEALELLARKAERKAEAEARRQAEAAAFVQERDEARRLAHAKALELERVREERRLKARAERDARDKAAAEQDALIEAGERARKEEEERRLAVVREQVRQRRAAAAAAQ